MIIGDVVYARLAAFAGLTALIGGTPPRAYPLRLPQGVVYPAVTYARIGVERPSAMISDVGLLSPARVQCTAWALDYRTAAAVSEQLVACWQRFRGFVIGVEIVDTFIDNELDLDDPEAVAADGTQGVYQLPVDLLVHLRG
ncbi:MAG: tail completion protein gp17 [Gemmatimonadales bacterium]